MVKKLVEESNRRGKMMVEFDKNGNGYLNDKVVLLFFIFFLTLSILSKIGRNFWKM